VITRVQGMRALGGERRLRALRLIAERPRSTAFIDASSD
jgi:hypothetical protein